VVSSETLAKAAMFRIDPRGPVQNAQAPSQARPTPPAGAFQLPVAARADAPVRSGPVSMAGPLDTLVALQANEGAQERRKRQTKRGQDLLDGLDQLKAALLSGRVSVADLDRIKNLLSARREATDDPRLDDILAHIELRAAVEMAKLGR
jgi:hypothetical protein